MSTLTRPIPADDAAPQARATPHVLVIGTGLGGLGAALAAVKTGAQVTLVTKADLLDTATNLAQGGMAAMTRDLPGGQILDSPQLHVADTLEAGAGLTSQEVAEHVVGNSPQAVLTLLEEGVEFDRLDGPESPWVQGLEAAHSVARILHSGGDATGHAIQVALTQRIHELAAAGRIALHTNTLVTDIITDGDSVLGATLRTVEHCAATGNAQHAQTSGSEDATPAAPLGPERFIAADQVILATGGAGQLYPFTTNPAVATGDGIALALRAGAQVQDLEFIQFHPTALAAPGSPLISEAVRGEGATLVDEFGQRFMTTVDSRAELAPRDVVARAVFQSCSRTPDSKVFLDLSTVHTPEGMSRAEFLAHRFPTIHHTLAQRGINWAEELVPVSPAAHYMMGGIRTDPQGRTSIPGLWAVGECASTGLHGANRLASNSLLEAAVLGRTAGHLAASATLGNTSTTVRAPASDQNEKLLFSNPSVVETTPFSRAALQDLMWRHAGVVRSKEGLREAKRVLEGWQAASSSVWESRDQNNDAAQRPRQHALGLTEAEDRNLLLVAAAVVQAALTRTESRGAHHRMDYPELDPQQAQHLIWRLPTTQFTPRATSQPYRARLLANHHVTQERNTHVDALSR